MVSAAARNMHRHVSVYEFDGNESGYDGEWGEHHAQSCVGIVLMRKNTFTHIACGTACIV